jgi:hypothetical protein
VAPFQPCTEGELDGLVLSQAHRHSGMGKRPGPLRVDPAGGQHAADDRGPGESAFAVERELHRPPLPLGDDLTRERSRERARHGLLRAEGVGMAGEEFLDVRDCRTRGPSGPGAPGRRADGGPGWG